MEMSEKISEIISGVYGRTIMPDEAVEQILILVDEFCDDLLDFKKLFSTDEN